MAHQTNPTVNRGYTFQLLSFINIPLIMSAVELRSACTFHMCTNIIRPLAISPIPIHPISYDEAQCLPIDRIMFTFVYSSSLVSYDCNLTSLPNFHCNAHSWKFVGSRFQTPISNWFPFLAHRWWCLSRPLSPVGGEATPADFIGTSLSGCGTRLGEAYVGRWSHNINIRYRQSGECHLTYSCQGYKSDHRFDLNDQVDHYFFVILNHNGHSIIRSSSSRTTLVIFLLNNVKE